MPGYEVDLLQEFDQRLKSISALALVSIHSDSCTYTNSESNRFLKLPLLHQILFRKKTAHLTACLIQRYGSETGLHFLANSPTTI